MDAEAYQQAVSELYTAMNEVFLANNRLYAAAQIVWNWEAQIVWNWEANEMPSVILEELNETQGGLEITPMEVVEEEAVAETMRKKWERSWDGTIEAWLEARARRRQAKTETAVAQSAPMNESFFTGDA
jgi:creatinine amidohydrolase/Fe(II)-dependent formamide hydrolase-like protein